MNASPTQRVSEKLHSPGGPGGDARGKDTWKPLDCETAVLMRACLRPLMERAESWADLIGQLRQRGFGLAMREGRLFVVDMSTGRRVCSARFLGTSLAEMVRRLGRPKVRAVLGRDAAGEFRHDTP